MNLHFSFLNLLLKNDLNVMIKKIKSSFHIIPDLKREILNHRRSLKNKNHPINQKNLRIITFKSFKQGKKKPEFEYLINFLQNCLFLYYINFSVFSKKIKKLLIKIFLKVKHEKLNLSDLEFSRVHYLNPNFDKNSTCETRDDLYILKRNLLTFSFEGFYWLLFSENSRKRKNFYRIFLLTIDFSKKLDYFVKNSRLYLFCTEKKGLYNRAKKKLPKLKNNLIFNKNSIKFKKSFFGKNNFDNFNCKFFFFSFWKNEWNLGFLRYFKSLRVSRWIFQKITKLHGNLLLQPYIRKKGLIFNEQQNLIFPYIKKIGNLIQEFPHSIILKVRLLCHIISRQKFEKNVINLRLWTKDVQTSSHFNHLSFLLLFTDFIMSGPKTKNIFISTISLIQKNLFMLKDLFKIPQKAEKYLNIDFLKKTSVSFSSPLFFIENGLLDLGRKYILKLSLYSNIELQTIFFKYLIESESKTLFFYLLSKISKYLSLKGVNEKKILKILDQNGRWGLMYTFMYENLQKKKFVDYEEKAKI